MNYANMIEEKKLKKGFIIATLCSTLIGTFTSSMGLYDRLQDKRRQGKRDSKQDAEIKQLREQVETAQKQTKERDSELERRNKDDVGSNFERSGALIQKQFDEGYGRLGSRFAAGDTFTENQLQKQIITLQQTVITILQDALYNDRQLTRADMAKLAAASDAAREGSLDALRQHQSRLAVEEASPSRAPQSEKRSSPPAESAPLFCRYSLDVQNEPRMPLARCFAQGRDCRCPDCGVRLNVTSEDFWQIGKRIPVMIKDGAYEREVFKTREFHLGQRFVIKCHTADGEYACVLCNRFRDHDAICRTVESLVSHVGRFHEVNELERDVDLKETRPGQLLPAQNSVVRDVHEVEVLEYR